MSDSAAMPRTMTALYSTDRQRWQAVTARVPAADGDFYYSVKTTGVYCRPTCPSRLPRRDNVRFHASCLDAERAGFRPCKRCRPKEDSLARRRAATVERACRTIEEADTMPALDELAQAAGMSRYHFHRVFKAQTGVTPKGYAAAQRVRRVRTELSTRKTITAAIHGAGFNSASRFYETSAKVLGMTPTTFKSGGDGMTIQFAISQCWLGAILVAATDIGVCAILLGDEPDDLARDLAERFPQARLIGPDAAFAQLVAQVVGFVADPKLGLDLPLDIRGTAFQQQVWQALQKIPPGTITSYAEIARRIGCPKSARAVGQAVAANPLAVAIPCHRVVRTDGTLSGYRWGVERKDKLQQRERRTG
ncbi:MAG TPA: bifunctional DNA-binding transcriptional regulator/O6-methylguanine-DNA methyltransferase Ada [Pirellulaceae bacterium]|nr:bifunctional DNA-binding transcriptional regulator/O6-methylguanine-DNA methyltransferase Ada [Pirellulaceae bacterium]